MSEDDFELSYLFGQDLTSERDEIFAARVALEVSQARLVLRIRVAALYLAALVALIVLTPMMGSLISGLASVASLAAPGLDVAVLGLVAVGGVMLVTSRLQAVEI